MQKYFFIRARTEKSSKSGLLIGYYNYTVILTYVGMLVGFAGIMLTMNKMIPEAMLCLMVSGVCDMFDGAIASRKIRTKQQFRDVFKQIKNTLEMPALKDLITVRRK